MGWLTYSTNRGISSMDGKISTIFVDDELVKYFILDKERKICFVVKELSKAEKQSSENLYKFIVVNYNVDKLTKKNFNITEFTTNEQLFKLIIKYEACNEDYKRHFRINKILKNEKKKTG